MDWIAFGDWVERVGVSAALAIILAVGFIFILNKVFRSEEIKATANSQVDLKEAEGQTALARAIETQAESNRIQAQAFSGLDQTLKDNSQVSAKIVEALGQILNNQSIVSGNVNAIENNINGHIDSLINPYQELHRGHTIKLESIMETGRVLVESVNGLKKQHEQQSKKQVETLDAILETVKLLVEDTAELDIAKLTNDNHKENNS